MLTSEQARTVAAHVAASFSTDATLEAFAGVPAGELGRFSSALVAGTPGRANEPGWAGIARQGLPFAPVVDGEILASAPIEARSAG